MTNGKLRKTTLNDKIMMMMMMMMMTMAMMLVMMKIINEMMRDSDTLDTYFFSVDFGEGKEKNNF